MLKQLLKRVPGLHGAYRRLFRVDTPGQWLFHPETLDWMYDATMRRQLPRPYRVFALYCQAQSFLGVQVILGRLAFEMAARVYSRGESPPIRLDSAGRVIFVHARDPRMLQVPRELRALTASDSVLARFLAEGDSFIDVGANHGAFSVAAASFVGPAGAIVAFEPQRTLSELVERSLQENGVINFRVYSHACSDKEGEADFFVPRVSSGSAGLHFGFSARSAYDRIRVRTIRLDDALKPLVLPNAVFIKLDVEGHEPGVLRGASQFIRERRPRILMEINPEAMAAAGTMPYELRSLLAQLGCNAYRPLEQLDRVLGLDTLDTGWHGNVLLEFG